MVRPSAEKAACAPEMGSVSNETWNLVGPVSDCLHTPLLLLPPSVVKFPVWASFRSVTSGSGDKWDRVLTRARPFSLYKCWQAGSLKCHMEPLDELFFLVGFDQQPVTNQLCRQLMIKTSSVLLLPRCPSGNASPHDHQYYHDGGGVGCSLHGNEVHHLWGRWQNTQVSHRHDWRHCHPDRRSVSLVFDCCSQWTVYLIVFFSPYSIMCHRCLFLVRPRHHPSLLRPFHPC